MVLIGILENSNTFTLEVCFTNINCASRIFVDNEIKKKWLEGLKFRVVNMQELGYKKSDLPRTVTTCENHNGKFRVNCAIHNVKYMRKFYYNNFDVMQWEDVGDWIG